MKKVGMILATSVLALAGCGGGDGGGGGPYDTDPCEYAVCNAWESCQNGDCIFKATSQWDVIVASGTVAELNPNGESWDAFGGAPDPKVCLTINGDRECTTAKQDTFQPVWNEKLFSRAGAGNLMGGINTEYYDEDVASDDTICTGTITVDQSALSSGSLTLSCQDQYGTPTGSSFTLQFVYSP